ncbi:LANO_0H03796g1_1 [Lachancea nothofagi CBS 11611]|uniref:LANO_0H03796g1_1 n=1 Tax=Lachancea nothofagi CBS 11611 TaxID=1266666 RepID=A0A1G4KL27_9SACH|nr:LANO_0H03796g1_1 [Lachancea nothofagi CBS 11611]
MLAENSGSKSSQNLPQVLPEGAVPSNKDLEKNKDKPDAPKQDLHQDMASLMGFSGFDTTKNKKVQPKSSGGKRVQKKQNKNAKYRQYVNKKSKKLVQ